MDKIRFIYFDAANTLIHKTQMWLRFTEVLKRHGHNIEIHLLKKHHKLVSENVKFPDRTNKQFYDTFNSLLLNELGIDPTLQLTEEIFKACSYLPWEPFDDVKELKSIEVPMGIISNFNNTLKQKIESLIKIPFKEFIVSEDCHIQKPDVRIFEFALERIGIEPSSVLYVGDSISLDVEPALSLGLKACLVDRDSVYPNYKNRITGLHQLKQLLS